MNGLDFRAIEPLKKTILNSLSQDVRVEEETQKLYTIVDIRGTPKRVDGALQFAVQYENGEIVYVGAGCLNDRSATSEQTRNYFMRRSDSLNEAVSKFVVAIEA